MEKNLAQRLLRMMVLIRQFEEQIITVYPAQDMKTPVHLCIGQEAICAGVCAHLKPTDYLFSTHRSHGHCLAKGADIVKLYAEFYGRVDGCSRGKGGSMHLCAPEVGIPGTTAIVGGGIPLAVGTALASRLRGDNRVSVTFFGDGASDEGTFHEAMNFASLKKLAVVFVCENNGYATNSPISARHPHPDIHCLAKGYDIPAWSVDGNNVKAVYQAAEEAVKRAREGHGPGFLECKTYRWKGHVGPECDWEKGCRPKEELMEWMEKCPIESFKKTCLDTGVMTAEEFSAMVEETDRNMEQAIEKAKKSPYPQEDELNEHVYYDNPTTNSLPGDK